LWPEGRAPQQTQARAKKPAARNKKTRLFFIII